jgi:hypothetical protein
MVMVCAAEIVRATPDNMPPAPPPPPHDVAAPEPPAPEPPPATTRYSTSTDDVGVNVPDDVNVWMTYVES